MNGTEADARGGDGVDPGRSLLEVEALRTWLRSPQGPVRAVDGVGLRLDAGRTLGIVGESGSGKTMLARSIMGLLPWRQVAHASGSVRFHQRDLRQLSPRELERIWGRDIAMIFQDPMTSLNPVLKIGAQIVEPLRIHLGMSRKAAQERAVELLGSVGIPEPEQRVGAYPHQLSGGMRQRVLCAIALACDPDLLLADEPTTALDVTVQAQDLLDLLSEQQASRRMAMILVTHDLGVVADRADEVAVMYAGRIVERAPTEELFTRTRMPYTAGLIRSIPRLANPSHTRLQVIPGRPPSLADLPRGCPFAPRCPNVQDRCRRVDPPLASDGESGHEFACFFPVGTPEGEEALARNRAEGVEAALAITHDREASHGG